MFIYFKRVGSGMAEVRIFTRNFAASCVVCVFLTMFFFMFFTGMTTYAEDALGESGTVSGLLASSLIFGDLAARMYSGGRVDRWGKRNTAIVGMAVSAVLCAAYFVTENVPALMLVRTVQGFAYGCAANAVAAAVVEDLPPERRGRGIGYYSLSYTLSSAIGPFLCIWLLNNGTYDAIFAWGAAFAAVSSVCALLMTDDRARYADAPAARGLSLRDCVEPSAVPLAIVCFLFFFAYSGILTYTPMYGEDIGLEDYATFFFVFVSTGSLTSRLFLGRIYDDYGENAGLLPFFVLGIVGFLMYSLADAGWQLVVSGILVGLLMAQISSVLQSVMVRRAPKARYAVAVSTYSVALDLSYCVGPMLHGTIKDAFGFQGNFLIMTALIVLDLAVYLAVHGIRVHRHPESENTQRTPSQLEKIVSEQRDRACFIIARDDVQPCPYWSSTEVPGGTGTPPASARRSQRA